MEPLPDGDFLVRFGEALCDLLGPADVAALRRIRPFRTVLPRRWRKRPEGPQLDRRRCPGDSLSF